MGISRFDRPVSSAYWRIGGARIMLHVMDPILTLLGNASGRLLRATLAAGVALGPSSAPAAAQAAVDPNVAPRAAQLERENMDLKARLDWATTRTRGMLEQVRFLRQQATRSGGAER